MSIEYVCIVGSVGFRDAELDRGCVEGCDRCGGMREEYLRVEDLLLCVECAAGQWNDERARRALAPLHHRHGPDGRIVEDR